MQAVDGPNSSQLEWHQDGVKTKCAGYQNPAWYGFRGEGQEGRGRLSNLHNQWQEKSETNPEPYSSKGPISMEGRLITTLKPTEI
jgi:hypothetical protein